VEEKKWSQDCKDNVKRNDEKKRGSETLSTMGFRKPSRAW